MKLTSRITVWFQALVIIGCFSTLNAQTKAGSYQAAEVQGTATWTNPETKAVASLTSGQKLPQGAIITTSDKSSVVLVFSSGAIATISANSSLEVTRFSQSDFSETDLLDDKVEPSVSVTDLKLINGEVTSEVRRLRTGSEYNVNTPVGAAGVRGTLFSVSYNAATGEATISVLSGVVVAHLPTGEDFNVSANTLLRIPGQNGQSGQLDALTPEQRASLEAAQARMSEFIELFRRLTGVAQAEIDALLEKLRTEIIKTPDSTITVSGDTP